MSDRDIVREFALANGWTVYSEPQSFETGTTEFRRRNGRGIEYICVTTGVQDQIISASWAPSLNGVGGGQIARSNAGKLATVLAQLDGE